MKIEPVRGWAVYHGHGEVHVVADCRGPGDTPILIIPLIDGEDPVQVDVHYKYGDDFKVVPYPVPAEG